MTKVLERRLERLEAGSNDEPCIITDNTGEILFQGTNAEFRELLREVSGTGRGQRRSKVDQK